MPCTGLADLVTVDGLRGMSSRPVEVQRVRTPVSIVELRAGLAEGHRRALGAEASPCRVRMALTQLIIEHGAEGGCIFCFNLGNLQVGNDDPSRTVGGADVGAVARIAGRAAAGAGLVNGRSDELYLRPLRVNQARFRGLSPPGRSMVGCHS